MGLDLVVVAPKLGRTRPKDWPEWPETSPPSLRVGLRTESLVDIVRTRLCLEWPPDPVQVAPDRSMPGHLPLQPRPKTSKSARLDQISPHIVQLCCTPAKRAARAGPGLGRSPSAVSLWARAEPRTSPDHSRRQRCSGPLPGPTTRTRGKKSGAALGDGGVASGPPSATRVVREFISKRALWAWMWASTSDVGEASLRKAMFGVSGAGRWARPPQGRLPPE